MFSWTVGDLNRGNCVVGQVASSEVSIKPCATVCGVLKFEGGSVVKGEFVLGFVDFDDGLSDQSFFQVLGTHVPDEVFRYSIWHVNLPSSLLRTQRLLVGRMQDFELH